MPAHTPIKRSRSYFCQPSLSRPMDINPTPKDKA